MQRRYFEDEAQGKRERSRERVAREERGDEDNRKEGVLGGIPEPIIEAPYRQMIGALMYAANGSRPDISFAVSSLSRFNEEPRDSH